MLTREHRILLVDDNRRVATDFADAIRSNEHLVDVCNDEDAALGLLRRQTYDLAIVDINLSGLDGDRSGGLSLIRHLKASPDGTSIMVVSGEESTQFAADLVQDLGVQRFVSKAEITNQGVQTLLDAVETALEAKHISLLGRFSTITQVLCGSPDHVCVDTMLRRLKPNAGHRGLEIFLTQFLGRYLPLIPPAAAAPWIHWVEESTVARGNFWSKGIGSAIELRMTARANTIDRSVTPGVLDRCESSGIVGTIQRREDDRSAYSDV